jgi:hypothetical protein
MAVVRRLLAAACVAVLAALPVAGHAYPDGPNITISIPGGTLYGGDTFTFTVTSDVECDWTVTYADGDPTTRTGQGTTLSGTFTTREVDQIYSSPIVAVCTYVDQGQSAQAVASATVTLLPRGSSGDGDGGDGDGDADTGSDGVADADGQTAGDGSDASPTADSGKGDGAADDADRRADDRNGLLPGTGGVGTWIVILGCVAVLCGAALTAAARRAR